jgi:hypothetical protein
MADNDKFTMRMELDTKDANKKIDETKKKAQDAGKEVEKERKPKINTDQVVNAFNQVNNTIGLLDANLGNLGNKINTIFGIGKVTAFIGSVVALGYAFKKVYDITSNTSHEIVNLSNKAGSLFMNTNNLKAWETSFKAIGLSAQDADSALSKINDTIINQLFNPNPQTAALYSRLGVEMRDDKGNVYSADQQALQAMSNIKKMDPYSAQFLGRQFGFSPETISRIRTEKDFNKILADQKAKPVVTPTQEIQARDYVKKEADLSSSFEMLQNKAIMPLASVVSDKLIPTLNAFDNTLSDLISQFGGVNNKSISGNNSPINKIITPDASKNLNYYATHPMFKVTKTGTIAGNLSDFNNKIKSYFNKRYVDDLLKSKNISSKDQDLIHSIISKESGYLNVNSSVKATTGANKGKSLAYGVAQFMPSTLKGYLGNNANPMDIGDSIRGLQAEIVDFKKYATSKNMQINPDTFYTYHHLGKGNMEQARIAQQHGAQTFGNVYDTVSPSGKMRSQNTGLANVALPDMQPTATQSSVISNVVNNNKTVNNVATAHIASVNVQANDPQGLMTSLVNSSGTLDFTNNMYGMLA